MLYMFFLPCGIIIYSKKQRSLSICRIYIYLFTCFCVFIHESDVKAYNPRKLLQYLVYSLYKKNVPFL